MKNIVVIILMILSFPIFAQNDDLIVTESVREHRAKGYPLSVLEELPLVKGCEALASNQRLSAQCMKDQINFMFQPFMQGAEKVSNEVFGVRVYIEFSIQPDGSISDPIRMQVSENELREFVENAFEAFKQKVVEEELFLKPGRVHNRDVSTLYAVRYMKAFTENVKN